MADDYFAMKPKMLVKPGENCSKGTHFADRKAESVVFTSQQPVHSEVNRGDRRAFGCD